MLSFAGDIKESSTNFRRTRNWQTACQLLVVGEQGCIFDDIRVYTVSLDSRNSQARCVPSGALHGASPIPDGTYVTYARENGGFIRLDGCGVHREVAAGCSLEAAVSWLTENRNARGIGQPKIHGTETETRLCRVRPASRY